MRPWWWLGLGEDVGRAKRCLALKFFTKHQPFGWIKKSSVRNLSASMDLHFTTMAAVTADNIDSSVAIRPFEGESGDKIASGPVVGWWAL